jgi:aldose 1-epimerase
VKPSAASAPSDDALVLRAGDASVTVSPHDGGRLSSLRAGGHELLTAVSPQAPFSGCYAMAPYAGRVRGGLLRWEGREVALPVRMGGHAIHGLCYDRPWDVVAADPSSAVLRCAFDPRWWPWDGWAVQRVTVEPGAVTCRLEVHTTADAMPAWCGFHPWFRRELAGVPVTLDIAAAGMLRRDGDGIPDGRVVPVADGPLDDALVGVTWPVTLRWPGVLTLQVSADTDVAVVYTGRDQAVCVEPQTAPPDAAALGSASVVRRDAPLSVTMRLAWDTPST